LEGSKHPYGPPKNFDAWTGIVHQPETLGLRKRFLARFRISQQQAIFAMADVVANPLAVRWPKVDLKAASIIAPFPCA
jgi:hypothetical protein